MFKHSNISNNNTWRERRKSFNTNPLSSQVDNFFATSSFEKDWCQSLAPEHFENSADIFAKYNIVDNTEDNSCCPREVVPKCSYALGGQSNRTHLYKPAHGKIPLDLSYNSCRKVSQSSFDTFSKHSNLSKPLNNNTNATVCLETSFNCPTSNFSTSLKRSCNFRNLTKCTTQQSHYFYQEAASCNTDCPEHSKIFSESFHQNNKQDSFEAKNLPQYYHYSKNKQDEKLFTKHSKEGLFLALAKKTRDSSRGHSKNSVS